MDASDAMPAGEPRKFGADEIAEIIRAEVLRAIRRGVIGAAMAERYGLPEPETPAPTYGDTASEDSITMANGSDTWRDRRGYLHVIGEDDPIRSNPEWIAARADRLSQQAQKERQSAAFVPCTNPSCPCRRHLDPPHSAPLPSGEA